MKKFTLIALTLVILFAFASVANAATIPADSITITAQTVDYVSALAGIAKPTNTAHYENERFAVLVKIDVPSWYDTSNMGVVIEKSGLALDGTTPLNVATGNYLIFGTLYSTAGSLKITLQDNAISNAATVQALWAALYGDRSVSATVDFASVPVMEQSIPTTPVVDIPKTGDAPTTYLACACIFGAVICILFIRRRKRRTE